MILFDANFVCLRINRFVFAPVPNAESEAKQTNADENSGGTDARSKHIQPIWGGGGSFQVACIAEIENSDRNQNQIDVF